MLFADEVQWGYALKHRDSGAGQRAVENYVTSMDEADRLCFTKRGGAMVEIKIDPKCWISIWNR